jgi:putative sterol carrier protein
MADLTIKDIFTEMPKRFIPEAAQGAGEYYMVLNDGSCEVTEGTHDSPNMTMTMDGKDYVDMTTGKLNGQMAFMQGKLKIAGDLELAMKMQNLFKMA